MHTFASNHERRRRGGLASGQREVHLHLRFDLDRLSIEQVGLVLPLLDRFDRGWGEHGMSADELQIHDVAGFVELSFQGDDSLDPRLTRERRIFGCDLLDDLGGHRRPANLNALWSCFLSQDGRGESNQQEGCG